MQIGELAERTGVSRRSIRYYEQKGLLQAHRTDKGWREYDESAVNGVLNIQNLLEVGLTIEGIQRVAPCLSMAMVDFMSCENVEHAIGMYEERLSVVDEKLKILERHRLELANRIALLRSGAGADDFDALLKQVQQA
ncbi:MerR family transcriptional regulator [Streptomyces sp. CAI-21]|uniref:MerR family transcriptional regulator n=1 Tax=Streptomyces albidoflavus TaxID=1886 RepID=UPI0004CB9DB1|nr:MerR family transcriptional regulator [Streptomyces albidoflavus]KAF0795760.1 hypothetical protein P405_16490 [Streptomyces sp. FR-008]MBO1287092.1 MerR family transcriptional regulator [Streptomyces sampsonii]NUW09482.1 MerR family transcriptional regulator [Streptomyces sp. CAI-21]NVI30957.1 MerR family transcriptional regulator [Streptomyces sp. CAI-17]RZE80874.1 MerR family DNA-binding transcriptional regulator [Streptomyces albidoflavus]